jgi:metallophosphoesterase superfamily enzyme
MMLEFIGEGPALLVIGTIRVLAVADLHIGIESDMARHGLHFRSRSTERLERLGGCIRRVAPDLLVLLGDVKHNVPYTSRQEYRELPDAITWLRASVPLRVVPGNHDTGIERFLDEEEILPRDGAVIDGIAYLHGHTYPAPNLAGRLIVSGHHHPMINLQDEVGCSLRSPAYLHAPLDESCIGFSGQKEEGAEQSRVLFMPAFNELTGYDITKTAQEPFSPLSRCMRTGEAEVYLPDGTFVGPLSVLEEHGSDKES